MQIQNNNRMSNTMGERKYYIDNLRWLWILLLIPYHCASAYNCWGTGNYIILYPNKPLSSLVIFITPFFMPLLFVLAGISAKLSLQKRSYRQFTVERVKKLVIPLITGIVTVVAFMTYIADKFFNNYSGNFFSHYLKFFSKITDTTGYDGYFGPGHLWFLLYLFVVSMIALLIIFLQRKFFKKLSFKNIPTWVLPLLLFIPIIMKPILDISGQSVGQDLGFFLIGFYIISEDSVIEKLQAYKYVNIAITLISDVTLVYIYVFMGIHDGILITVLYLIAQWFGIMGFIGLASLYFNVHNKITAFLTKNSFLFYIFHFMPLLAAQYFLYLNLRIDNINLLTAVSFTVSVVLAYIITFLLCVIVRKVPVINTLFGVKKN